MVILGMESEPISLNNQDRVDHGQPLMTRIKRIRQLILESEGMRTEDLVYETQFSKSSLLTLLKEIGAKKIRSRWCPKELTARQMQARMNIAGKHLARYQRESGFLNKIIAIDETWLKSYDPRDSKAETEWLLPGQKP